MSREKANKLSDIEIKKRDLRFSKFYDSNLDINIMNEDAIAFRTGNFIYEAHISDSNSVDYTVYEDNFDEIEGGQIDVDVRHFSIRELLDYIDLPFNASDIMLLDHDALEDLIY